MNLENSLYKVTPSNFIKNIRVPASKSFANRALILAALADRPITLENIPLSHDVEKMIKILKFIGLEIIESENSIQVLNSFPACEKISTTSVTIHPGDGGTTTRFIIPLLSLGKNKYIIEPEGRMRDRPISGLINNLKSLGVSCDERDDTWLSIQGPIINPPKSIHVDASQTTQHATALALVLPNTHIVAEGMDFSKSYWEMTLNLISRFKNLEDHFVIPVDFSSLSYPLALAAACGEVTISNCFEIDICQADSVFINLLQQMGVSVNFSDQGLHACKPSVINSIQHDCSDCPDLVPTLGFICSMAQGNSLLKNVKVLRYKESDRLEELFKIFKTFNVSFQYDEIEDVLMVSGPTNKVSGVREIITAEDHRMVMVSYLFLRTHDGGSVNFCNSVSKSFGNFFETMK